jgi:SSS family solute:Na+ symporter
MITYLLILLLPIFAFALMHLPQFAAEQAQVHESLASLGTPQLQKQMLVPVALSTILPIGLMGFFAAVLLAAAISTDDSYLHSWGSIFIQDVVMPFRKTPLSPGTHMLLLRLSIFGVAAFAFVFSLLFPLNDYILMYFQITGAIYLGGAGSAILGGLYWKRGSTEGAWAGMITGSTLAVTGIALRNIIWPWFLPAWKAAFPDWDLLQSLPDKFPFNGVVMAVISAGTAVFMYVVFSLFSRRPPADMDRLFHRGQYAVETAGHHPGQSAAPGAPGPFLRRLGINADFTLGDKFIYFFKITWVLFFFAVFLIGTIAGFIIEIPDAWWISWWAFFVGLTATVAAVSVVWFLWGGFRDFGRLVRDLRAERVDPDDDGWVPQRKSESDP